jgi:hypothetical protein
MHGLRAIYVDLSHFKWYNVLYLFAHSGSLSPTLVSKCFAPLAITISRHIFHFSKGPFDCSAALQYWVAQRAFRL